MAPAASPRPAPFLFSRPATTRLYTLSLHDALPIPRPREPRGCPRRQPRDRRRLGLGQDDPARPPRGPRPAERSEEHTSELQSRRELVCRLLLEKKNDARVRYPTPSCSASAS